MNQIAKNILMALVPVIGVAGVAAEPATQSPSDNRFNDRNGNGAMEAYENANLGVAERIDDLLGRMSLEQKVRMVSGMGFSLEERSREIDKVPGAAGYTYPLKEFGIPSIVLADGPAGLRISPTRKGEDRSYYATAFPVETLLASSWDAGLLESVGSAMGNEIKEYGVDVFLAPGMNIHRNPLAGRNFEYYSEDPFLSGHMAAAMVNGVQSAGVGATIKHYVANNQETNRILVDTLVSERALREIYLRGFEIAVTEAQPWAIMSAYNKINGTAASEHEPLLTGVLRDEWGFEGVVMTDWFAGYDTVEQMRAGNELLMPGTDDGTERLLAATQSGELDESVLDRNVRYILEMVFKSPTFAGYDYSDNPDLKANAATARAAAAQGVVLLKNDARALPLKNGISRIAAFGTTSYDFIAGGAGSGDVNEAYTVSLVQGLENGDFQIDDGLKSTYEAYIAEEREKQPEKEMFFELTPPIPEMPVSQAMLDRAVAENDIAFITLGRNSGEFQDRKLEGDFYLTDAEQAMIEAVASAFHAAGKKVVTILNIGNVIETVSWHDKVDAIVLPWQGGQEAGNAVVDVLTGKVNPAGKLPTTFPVKYEDVPSAPESSFPGVAIPGEKPRSVANGLLEAQPWIVKYEEGIYVGYRYYDAFEVKPAYEFGYGLSYTEFDYAGLKLSSDSFKDTLGVRVTVTNSGKVAGREVVQLYLSAPDGELSKPVRELKGFAKTRELAPGESQELEFELNERDLASYAASEGAWVAEKGGYRVSIGASSRDIRAQAEFRLPATVKVATSGADLSPAKELEMLEP